jgi:hypothetical protein
MISLPKSSAQNLTRELRGALVHGFDHGFERNGTIPPDLTKIVIRCDNPEYCVADEIRIAFQNEHGSVCQALVLS